MKSLRLTVLAASLLVLAAAPAWAAPQRLSAEDLASLQMKGASAEDHLKMAAHFRVEAEELAQEAARHEAMGKRYNRPNLPPKIASLNRGMSRHCTSLSHALKKAAREAGQLADSHKAMADEVSRQK